MRIELSEDFKFYAKMFIVVILVVAAMGSCITLFNEASRREFNADCANVGGIVITVHRAESYGCFTPESKLLFDR
jgi:hypothetical protein